MYALFRGAQCKMIIFFPNHLGHNHQLFENTCHQLNKCVQNQANEISKNVYLGIKL